MNSSFRSYWYNNPHFNGTYSFETVKSHSLCQDTCQEILTTPLIDQQHRPIVQFAGEATSPHHFSTVHGAVETGFREAKRIIDYYQSPK